MDLTKEKKLNHGVYLKKNMKINCYLKPKEEHWSNNF